MAKVLNHERHPSDFEFGFHIAEALLTSILMLIGLSAAFGGVGMPVWVVVVGVSLAMGMFWPKSGDHSVGW
jgi:hypothetical protein